MVCSIYKEKNLKKGENKIDKIRNPIVIYSHGNAGCRMSSSDEIPFILSYGMDAFCFDFAGCGNSKGDTISLGFNEQKDLSCCVEELKKRNYSRIGLWGRLLI